jgi:hypothetical protein
MTTISIRTNFADIINRLENVAPKQVDFAVMTTINKAAYEASQEIKQEIRNVFDGPTPWVVGGVRYRKATKGKLRAIVHLDFWGNKQGVTVEKVLAAEIGGGQRRLKRFESALSRIGILPSGMAVVPGSAAEMDGRGNMKVGQIIQILSWFKAFGEQGYSANMRDGGRRLGRDKKRTGQRGFSYFVLKKRHGKLPPGIYKRFELGFGSAIRPVMIFVRAPSYRPRLDFVGVGMRAVNRVVRAELPVAVANAVKTALK